MSEKTGEEKGLRFNDGKPRYDLENPLARRDMIDGLTYGARKYTTYNDDGSLKSSGDRNWEKGMQWTTVIASAKRHLAAIERGEDYDYDENCEGCKEGDCRNHSGLLHVSLLQVNAHFLNSYYYLYPQGDDRPKRGFNLPKIGLDIDEVIADWLGAWMERFDIKEAPSSWYFDRDIMERFDELKECGELNKFYMSLKPHLNPSDLPFEPHCYITSRPVDTAVTECWLDDHNFPTKKVYTVEVGKSKADVAKEAGIEVFIDDSYSNFLDLNKNGILCYLYDRPHNRKYDVGHLRLKSLNDLPFFGNLVK